MMIGDGATRRLGVVVSLVRRSGQSFGWSTLFETATIGTGEEDERRRRCLFRASVAILCAMMLEREQEDGVVEKKGSSSARNELPELPPYNGFQNIEPRNEKIDGARACEATTSRTVITFRTGLEYASRIGDARGSRSLSLTCDDPPYEDNTRYTNQQVHQQP